MQKIQNGNGKGLIFFYGKRCSYTSEILPFFVKFTKEMTARKQKVSIYKVNYDQFTGLGNIYGVSGTPSFVVAKFNNGKPIFKQYFGIKRTRDLLEFIEKEIGFDDNIHTDISIELNKESFENLLQDNTKNLFVYFSSPDDHFYPSIYPIIEELGDAFLHDQDIVIARMIRTPETDPIYQKYQIEGYPTFLFFQSFTRQVIRYQDARRMKYFSEFIKKNKGFIQTHDEL